MSDNGHAIVANNTPFTSMPWMSPELEQLFYGAREIGQVVENTAIVSPDFTMVNTPAGPHNDLMSMRSRYGFLPIMPMPGEAESIILTVANTPGELRITDAAAYMMLGITVGVTVFCSRNGNAEVPTIANTVDGFSKTKSFIVNNGQLFYVGGIKALSFVSPTAGAFVSCLFYSPDQLPRL